MRWNNYGDNEAFDEGRLEKSIIIRAFVELPGETHKSQYLNASAACVTNPGLESKFALRQCSLYVSMNS